MPLKHIHLPHELWFVIAQLLDRSTLKSLSLVSSTHRDAIQPALFSHLKLKCVNPGEIGTVEFLRRNEKLLKLALWVRRLDLVGPIINVSDHRVVLVDALASMRNLRSLSILDHPFQNETHFRETVEILKENCTSLTSVTFDVSSTEFAHNAQMALHGVERITWKDRDFTRPNPFICPTLLSLAAASSSTITHLSLLTTLKHLEATHFIHFSDAHIFPELKSLRLGLWNIFNVRIFSAVGKFLNAHPTIQDLQLGWGEETGLRGLEWDVPGLDPKGFLPNLRSLDIHPTHLTFFASFYPSSLRDLKNLRLGWADYTYGSCVSNMLEALKAIVGIPKLKRLVLDAGYDLHDSNFISMMNDFAVFSPRLESWEARFRKQLHWSDIADMLSRFPDLRNAYLDGTRESYSIIGLLAVTVADACPKFERFAAYAVHNGNIYETYSQDYIIHIKRGEVGSYSTEVEEMKGLWSFV